MPAITEQPRQYFAESYDRLFGDIKIMMELYQGKCGHTQGLTMVMRNESLDDGIINTSDGYCVRSNYDLAAASYRSTDFGSLFKQDVRWSSSLLLPYQELSQRPAFPS
jgi:hypothetical protein